MMLMLIAIGILLAVFAASYVVEGFRQRPVQPKKLYWAPDLPIQYTEIDGNRIRYIKTGSGPTLVLLHTLRTQLDIFEKVVPTLAKSFTVYAPDYPGHGFSDIPKADYAPELFVKAVEGFLDKLDLTDVTLAGISIGGVISLIIAAKQNPRVTKVIAINPYDYGGGTGLARANVFAWLTVNIGKVPVLGKHLCAYAMLMWRRAFFEAASPIPRPSPRDFQIRLTPRGADPSTIRLFSISSVTPICGTLPESTTAISRCPCLWFMASVTGHVLTSGVVRWRRFLMQRWRRFRRQGTSCRSISRSVSPT
jgi:pimeloyl-ACP methyl ester carboxylesterase